MGSNKHRGTRGRRRTGVPGSQVRTGTQRASDNLEAIEFDDDGQDFILYGQFTDTTDSDNTADEIADGRSKHARRKAKIKKAQQATPPDDGFETKYTRQGSNIISSQTNKDNINSPELKNMKKAKKAAVSTNFVRSETQFNQPLASSSSNDPSATIDGKGRNADFNKLQTDISNLDINDDDFDQLPNSLLPNQPDYNANSNSSGTDSTNDDDGSDYDTTIADMTDDDILQLLLQCKTDKDMHDYLAGLSVAELDRLEAFFEEHGEDDDEVSDFADLIENDNDLLTYEEQYLEKLGLYDEDDEISPEMFQLALEEVLVQVPPSLKTGMKNRISHDKKAAKNEKRMEKKERKKESKANKRTKKIQDTVDAKPSMAQPADISNMDRRIRDFINDDQLNSFQFAPMDKTSRRQLHILVTAYNLSSNSIGAGKLRSPILTKTDKTFIPRDRRNIDLFIEEAQSTITVQRNLTQKHRLDQSSKSKEPKAKPGKKTPVKKKKQGLDRGVSTHGTVVASNAAPITESNVGHRMMIAMGWKEGNGLGTNQEGITDPIEAVIRGKRRGLGA